MTLAHKLALVAVAFVGVPWGIGSAAPYLGAAWAWFWATLL